MYWAPEYCSGNNTPSCQAFYSLVRHYNVLWGILSTCQTLYRPARNYIVFSDILSCGTFYNLSGIILSCLTFNTLVRHSIVLSDNLSRRRVFSAHGRPLFFDKLHEHGAFDTNFVLYTYQWLTDWLNDCSKCIRHNNTSTFSHTSTLSRKCITRQWNRDINTRHAVSVVMEVTVKRINNNTPSHPHLHSP